MVLLARAFGKRVVLSPRSGLILDDLERSPLIRSFARLLLRRCHVVICQSRSWRDFYQSLSGLPTSHFVVIPNWLDTTPYLRLSRPRAAPSKEVHIIYVGWIETYKGVYDLVEAVSLFREPLKDSRIHVCGEGNESHSLRRRVADAGLSHLFEFHGWLNFPEKLEQLRKADVFVLPSHREGLPNALLEAMAAGLPVIATRVGGVPEVLDEDGIGILLDPHDTMALGEALAELASKADLRVSLGKRAREHVLAQYDVSHLLLALDRFSHIRQTLVHTGQHYDRRLSEIFFRELQMPEPDLNLEVGSGTHGHQTAQVMIRLEPVLMEKKPAWVVVYGDVNSTVASTLVCSKLQIKLAHVEAGLRSFDRTMPEEINRLVTDQLADLLFTPSADADENLLREGVSAARIRRVGNIMIDSLVKLLPRTEGVKFVGDGFDLSTAFGLVTLHRPANVDVPESLSRILSVLGKLSQSVPLIFPIHPRTQQQIEGLDVCLSPQLKIMDPVGYIEFLALQRNAAFVITDSGGGPGGDNLLRNPVSDPEGKYGTACNRAAGHKHAGRQ